MIPYCSLLDVQVQIGNSKEEITELLVSCIEQATSFIDNYCKRSWQPISYTADNPLKVHPKFIIEDTILLPFPVQNLTSLMDKDSSGKSILLEDIEWYEANRTIIAPRKLVLPVFVEGEFGYPSEEEGQPSKSLPALIRRAATLIASSLSGEYRKERVGLDGNTINILETQIPKEAITLLSSFRCGDSYTTF